MFTNEPELRLPGHVLVVGDYSTSYFSIRLEEATMKSICSRLSTGLENLTYHVMNTPCVEIDVSSKHTFLDEFPYQINCKGFCGQERRPLSVLARERFQEVWISKSSLPPHKIPGSPPALLRTSTTF